MSYCTVDDVRVALQETVEKFDNGAWGESNHDVVVRAIQAQEEWIDKELHTHFYVPNGLDEDDENVVPTTTKQRTDEHDIPTSSIVVAGRQPEPKLFRDWYTRFQFDRRHVQSLNQLLVRMPDGEYEDWTETKTGGVWPDALNQDYMIRVNNGGVSQLNLDTSYFLKQEARDLLDDADTYDERRLSGVEEQWEFDQWRNAVYVDIEYGHEGLPQTIRRAVALRVASELLMDDQANLGLPEQSQLVNAESKKQAYQDKAEELLEPYRREEFGELRDET